MDIQEKLLRRIETFLKTQGMAETTFGRLAVNDGKFVARLRAHANMTLATLDKAGAFVDEATAKKEAAA